MSASSGNSSATPPREGHEIDSGAGSVATEIGHVADGLPPDGVLVVAIREPGGTPTEVVLLDGGGKLDDGAGVPEDQRVHIAELLSVAARKMSNEAVDGKIDGAGQASQEVTRLQHTQLQPAQTVTEARSAPAAPRPGDDLHRTIVEESPLPLILLDRESAVIYVSPSVPYDLGWSKSELIGHRLLDFLHPDDRERVARVMSGAAAAQRLGTVMTLRWRRRYSGYVAVEAAIRRVVGEVGEEVEGAVIALRTNPLQWSGLGEVLLARERQRTLADGANCGMAIVSGNEDTLGAVLEANTPLGRMLGITRGQLAALPLTSFIAEEDAGRVLEALQAVAADGGSTRLEATVVPRIGRQRVVMTTIAASPNADHPGKELVVRMEDTTDDAELVAELSQTIDRLERSNDELAGLARITAHDLAAPLRAVSGLIDLLPQADTSPDTRLTFDAIRSAIDRMQAMVAGITGYVQARSEEPTRALIDLNLLGARARETLLTEIAERGASFRVEELPSVFGDEHQLERVFLNLISNALKYSGERVPEISVYSHRAAGGWRISIADHGVGVVERDRERIFELFARGDTASGNGIGLATCRRIVELHGGRIWVEPNEPTGTIFHFTLPDEPTVAGG